MKVIKTRQEGRGHPISHYTFHVLKALLLEHVSAAIVFYIMLKLYTKSIAVSVLCTFPHLF